MASRYANALADLVLQQGTGGAAEDALEQLRSFADILKESPDLHEVLNTPVVPIGRKKAVISRILGLLRFPPLMRNFVFVLLDHRRIPLLSEIVPAFEEALDERLGFARADILSARELTAPQRAEITARLERLTGKKIRSRYSVDESLIGGALARIGSTVYDGSVRGQLEALQRRLSAEA